MTLICGIVSPNSKVMLKVQARSHKDSYFTGAKSIQPLSRVWLFVTPWTTAHQASLSITNSQSLLKLTCIESVMLSNHLVLCRPLLLLPSIFSSIRVFSNESVLHIRWPKYWSFSFSISPSNTEIKSLHNWGGGGAHQEEEYKSIFCKSYKNLWTKCWGPGGSHPPPPWRFPPIVPITWYLCPCIILLQHCPEIGLWGQLNIEVMSLWRLGCKRQYDSTSLFVRSLTHSG